MMAEDFACSRGSVDMLRCFWTTTTIRSPMLAGRLRLRRVMHSTRRAPELSMQFSIVWG